mmetsp:Transcript_58170/g.108916  ORF Transcript_58170/g.108916 Transcript_58170/m.108916 type:complete len:231 (+) Transcript_58170:100-792(+)
MGGCGSRPAKSEELNPWQAHVGPLQISSDGTWDLQPKWNFGVEGKGLRALAGLRDVRDGVVLDGMAIYMKTYAATGRNIIEVLRNVKAQHPFPIIDDLVAAIPHIAAEVITMIGADVTSDAVESVGGMLYVYTGLGVSAGIFLGWLNTDGYAMMGALGSASLLKSLALSFRVGMAEDKASARLIIVLNNIGFEATLKLRAPVLTSSAEAAKALKAPKAGGEAEVESEEVT